MRLREVLGTVVILLVVASQWCASRWGRLKQGFCVHRFEDVGEPIGRGDTTAPWPAIDELEQTQHCPRCGKWRQKFAGFIMDKDV